ncbi:MAG: Npt1/Npt2 family nucleotide transporter [Desulfobacterales bacterium]
MALPRRTLYAVFAIAGAASFLLCGYEFIRAVSTSLFIDAYGSRNLPWVMAAVPPGVYLIIYTYGRFLSWWGANRALAATSLLSAGLMVGAYGLLVRGYPFASAIIYVFREAYIVLIIEQYWSFVNSTLNPEQARSINGPFCGIASLGSIAGGSLVKYLAEPLGSETLLLLAAASLIPAAVCSVIAYTLAGEPQPSPVEMGGGQGHTGMRVLFKSRYLVFILMLILATQVVSTVLDLQFNGLVEESIPDKDARTAFYGGFYGQWLGISAAVLQFIGVPILLRLFPLRFIHLGIPMIHFVACGVLTVSPSLGTGAAAFLLFKAFDYSIFRAGKEMFYIPLSFDARYRAKQVIDSLGYRSAKGASALTIALIGLAASTGSGTIPGMAFSLTAMGMAVIWSGIASKLTTQYQQLTETKHPDA